MSLGRRPGDACIGATAGERGALGQRRTPHPVLIIRIVGGELEAADGAGIMQLKPGEDAIGVVDVLAGHLLRLGPELERLHADGALRGVGCEEMVGDGDGGEGLDGRLGGRGGAVAVRVVVSELLDELLEAGADEVVAEVGGEAEGGGVWSGVVEDKLDVGAAGDEGVDVALEEGQGVEGVGVEGRRRGGSEEVEGAGGGGGGEDEARSSTGEGGGREGEEGGWMGGGGVGARVIALL